MDTGGGFDMPLDRQLSAFQRDVNNISHVMYGNLPAEERFRLIVQSQAANNHAEVRRLIDTCPKKTYIQRDAAVMDWVERLDTLVLAFCQAWWSGYTHRRDRLPLEPEDMDLPMPDDAPAAEWFLGVTQRLTRTLETLVSEQWEAFSLFCRRDLTLEPETVLKSCMAPMLGMVQEALAEIKGIEPDPAKVEEYRDIMGKMWRDWCGY
jgi:hypothetical protein